MVAGVDQHAVLPEADFVHVHHVAQRGQDGDFVLQAAQFAGGDRTEARIALRRHLRHVAHREVEGLDGRDVADAAAQVAILGEGDEGAALLVQFRDAAGGCFKRLARANRSLHGLAGDFEELGFGGAGERERFLPGLGRGRFDEGRGAVAHHAAVVAGHIAGVGVVQHLGLVCAKALGGDHHGDDGSSTAGFPIAEIEIAREVEVIVLADGVENLAIQSLGLIVGVIVRKIGAGDD